MVRRVRRDHNPDPMVELPEDQRARPAPRPRRRSRGLRWLAGILVLGGALFLLRGRLLGPLIVRAAQRWAEREHAASIEIDRVAGGYLNDLELQGVHWRAGHGPLRVLDGRVRVEYSLVDWVRGRPAVRALELAIDALELDLSARGSGGTAPPALPARFPELELSLARATILLAGNSQLTLESGQLSLASTGESDVLSLRSPRIELAGPQGSLVADLELGARRRGGLVELDALRLGELASLTGTLELGAPERGLAWKLALGVAGGGATAEGRLQAGALSGELELAAIDLARASALAAPWTHARLSGTCDLRSNVSFTPGGEPRLRLTGETDLHKLGYEELALDRLAATFALEDDRLELEELHANRAADRFEARELALTLSPSWREIVAGASGEVAVSAADVTQLWRFERELGAVGVTLRGAVRPGPAFSLVGEATTEGGTLELRRGELTLDLDRPLASRIECLFGVDVSDLAPLAALIGRDWRGSLTGDVELHGELGAPVGSLRAEGESLVLEGVAFESLKAELSADGETLELTELAATAERFAGELRGSYRFDSRVFSAELLSLTSGERSLEAKGEIRWIDRGSGEIRFDELALRDGKLAESRLARPSTVSFEPGRRFSCESIELVSAVGGATGSFTVDGEDFVVRATLARLDLEALARPYLPEFLPLAVVEGPIEVSRRDGSLAAIWDLALDSTAGSARFTGNLAGPSERIGGTVALGIEGFRWPAVERLFGDQTLGLELKLAIGDEIALERAELRGSRELHASASGKFASGVDLGDWLPFRAESLDALRSRPFELVTDFELANLGWLADRFRALRRLEGRVAGRGVLSGTLAEPSFEGELHVREGELRLTSGVVLRDVGSDLAFHGRRMTVERLEGELGGAPLSASGTLDVSGESVELDVDLTGSNVLLFRDPKARMRADLEITLKGPLERLAISGKLALVGGRYSRDIELLRGALSGSRDQSTSRGIEFSIWRQPPLSNAQLDVAITSRAPYELENNFAKAELRADLHLGGTGAFPVFSGLVYVDKARVSLPSGTLRLDAGFVRFRPADPFFPELALSGSSRLSGYDIQVQVTGPYHEPEILLSSSPPLPNDELLVLFLTGQAPEGTFSERGKGAAESVSLYFAEDVLQRWFFGGSGEEGASLFDRLELEIGADVSQTGFPTARATLLLSDRPLGEKRVPFLAAERDQYDKINFGIGLRFRFR